jgi:hypothetical protein
MNLRFDCAHQKLPLLGFVYKIAECQEIRMFTRLGTRGFGTNLHQVLEAIQRLYI